MTAKKKIAVPATSQKSKKARKNKNANHDTVPLETSLPNETIVAESREVPSPQPQAEAAPLPTAATVKLSALEAALRVLADSGQDMNCRELIEAMAVQGYWSSPKGRTPAGTLYSCFLREIQSKGDKARVVKTRRGKFALRRSV